MSGRTPRRGRGAASQWRRDAARRRADESGGAVSLWVVLMVPVSAFAAVVAMAGPQRMAAESSMDEAADDLATLAVAWRDGHGMDDGPLPAFPPDCRSSDEWQEALAVLDSSIADFNLRSTNPALTPVERADALADRDAEQDKKDALEIRHNEWLGPCRELFRWVVADLGYLGVDVNSLRGFYSDSLTMAPSLDPSAPANQMALPCMISPKVEVHDAVHVTLAADWDSAGWAAAQVWPDGTRMGAESIGRLRRSVDNSELYEKCKKNLDVLDSQGRAVVLTANDPNEAPSRKLSQRVPGRNVIEG